jgi:hypothetical protein
VYYTTVEIIIHLIEYLLLSHDDMNSFGAHAILAQTLYIFNGGENIISNGTPVHNTCVMVSANF